MSPFERGGRHIQGEGLLGLTTIFFRLGGIRAMLQLSQGCMLVFVQLLEGVPRHGDVKSVCNIIPCGGCHSRGCHPNPQ
jgi:hypothetical protein